MPSPDSDRGEVVKAFIVLRSGIAGDETLAGELREHCKRLTAPYKYPRRIEFVPSLPKTVTGKISRRELKALERSLVSFVEACDTTCAGGPGPDCVILGDLGKHCGCGSSKL